MLFSFRFLRRIKVNEENISKIWKEVYSGDTPANRRGPISLQLAIWLMVTKLRLLQWGENPTSSGKEPPRRIATLKYGRQREEALWATWPFPMGL
jgi:hypothetical protein